MAKREVSALWVISVCLPVLTGAIDEAAGETPTRLFTETIAPILKSTARSSCVQCHLAAVDLKDYLLASHEKSFISLRDQGLVDLENPERSKILALIRKGDSDPDEDARLAHQKQRRAEHTALAAWIKACCSDHALRQAAKLAAEDYARPKRPERVIRHALKSRVIDSFIRNVWSHRMRCFPCHTPHEFDEKNHYEEYHQQFGERMNLFRKTPVATLQYLTERSREVTKGRLPLIHLQKPIKSLLVLKPASEKPKKDELGKLEEASSVEPVTHVGSLKIDVDDYRYKSFVTWIQDYQRTVHDAYASAEELPADNWYPTDQFVKIRRGPKDWEENVRVQLFVHAWNDAEQTWEADPIAFTQGQVKTRRKSLIGTLIVLAPKDAGSRKKLDSVEATLAPGKYLIKAYLDSKRRLDSDPTLLLGPEEFYGQAEVKARWRKGNRDAEVVRKELVTP